MSAAYQRQDRAAGVFILLSIICGAGFVVAAAVQNQWFIPRVTYHTTVHDGATLRPGAPILYSGIEIGRLGQITLNETSGIGVELKILAQHAPRVREGSVVEVRRVLGIGLKRVHLIPATSSGAEKAPQLPPGAFIPAREPMDLIDAMTSVDLARFTAVMERTLATSENVLTKLSEGDRLDRMVVAFDQLAPTMEQLNKTLKNVDKPLATLLSDPNLRRTLQGTAQVFSDPETIRVLHGIADALEPSRLGPLVQRTDRVLARLDSLLADDGHLNGTLAGAHLLLTNMSDHDKLGKLIDNVAKLSEQMAEVGPQMPRLTRDLLLTLREAVVVLKAMQKTWLLDSASEEARKELQRRDAIQHERDTRRK